MLSVLIPVYNHDVYRLVQSLHNLLSSANIQFEIICMDDASTELFSNNSKVKELSYSSYILVEQNIGRSAIRNSLVKHAQYNNLLFIDSDMLVINDTYIKKYLELINEYDIVYGGIDYEHVCHDHTKMLRWKFGKEREVLSVKVRNQKPYLSAKFCNLLVKKSVFDKITFEEQIKTYGHEDTLISVQMSKQNLKILHIDNTLLHDGLEDSKIYLEKVDIASKNLKKIASDYSELLLNEEIPLLKTYQVLQKFKLIKIYVFLYRILKNGIERNLLSKSPTIRLLDLYKLNSICSD